MKKVIKKVASFVIALAMIFTMVEIPAEVKAASTVVELGETITFGSYPQSRVTDEALLTALNPLANAKPWSEWISYEYTYGDNSKCSNNYIDMKYVDVSYNGNKYRAVKFSEYRPQNAYEEPTSGRSYQDNNGYVINTTYWFKFEPIEWVKIDAEEGMFVTSTIIDSQCFEKYDYQNENGYHYSNSSLTHYSSNYEYSSIRKWLNDDFYNTAFSSTEKENIATTEVVSDSPHHWDEENLHNTNDKVFLLTQDDTRDGDAFSSAGKYNAYLGATESNKTGTDYAKANGLKMRSLDLPCWLTRTTTSDTVVAMRSRTDGYVQNPGGSSGDNKLDDASYGVRPVICLTSQKGQICNHSYSPVVTQKATPTANGTGKKICSKCGDVNASFIISKASNITLAKTSYAYTGSAIKPAVTVKNSDGITLPASGYTVTYVNNTKRGTNTAYVKIEFKPTNASYSGSKILKFSIVKGANTITASNVSKYYSTSKQSFSIGAKAKESAKLSYSSDNKKVTVSSAGKVTIAAKFIGTATITIKSAATTNYNATSKKITISALPTKTAFSTVSNASGKKLSLKWKKISVATGYQIRYSTDSSFKKSVVTKTVSKNSTVSATYTRLTKGKTYYVQIRTYKTVGKTKVYSGWSTAKKIKISK